ncbi:MAG: seg [Candidatus Nomurabacteria bacterium]|nr:seg [Candidatus Nomurabacteria bacterium]
MNQKGFTLIETIIAIFLLTMTVGGLLTLTANGYFSVRYARNQITADNLVQESLEYVRNTRDTAFQQGSDWATWLSGFSSNGCLTATGCIVDPYTTGSRIRACSIACEAITFYPSMGFYGYADSTYPDYGQNTAPPALSTYVRTITMKQGTDPNQLTVTATLSWLNGTTPKTTTQSILLTNWHS